MHVASHRSEPKASNCCHCQWSDGRDGCCKPMRLLLEEERPSVCGAVLASLGPARMLFRRSPLAIFGFMRRFSGWWQGCRHGRLNHGLLRPKQAIGPGPTVSNRGSLTGRASFASYSSVPHLFCLFSFVGCGKPHFGAGTPLGMHAPVWSRWLVSTERRSAGLSGRFYPSSSPMRLTFQL